MAYADAQGTADWLMANPSKASAQAMNRAMAQMARADLQGAIAYLGGMTDEAARRSGFAGIADQMGKQDPRAAAQYTEANPSLADDAVYETLAWNAQGRDPELGADQLAKIGHPIKQRQAYVNYMHDWLAKDFDGARGWIEKQELPEDIRRNLEAKISESQSPPLRSFGR
jgi:type II secretory pathway component PulJ